MRNELAATANEATLSPEMLAVVRAVVDAIAERLEKKLEALAGPRYPMDEPASSGSDWLTAEAAARYLGMGKKALYTAVERGQVPASGLGRRLRFNRAGLDHLLHRRQGRGVQHRPRVPSPGKETERW